MKLLDKRLSAVADFVRDGSRVADIGTDHALLPVFLVQSGRCPCAIASDIGEGPAASARRTVEETGCEALVTVRIGDGLSPVSPDEVDDIVIAGMGGETIADILAAAPWVRNPHFRLVLQPMSKPERLRRTLAETGFTIEREVVVREGRRLYDVMAVAFTGEMWMPTLGATLVGTVARTPEGVAYVQKQRGRILDKLAGLPEAPENAAERAQLTGASQELDDWLKFE